MVNYEYRVDGELLTGSRYRNNHSFITTQLVKANLIGSVVESGNWFFDRFDDQTKVNLPNTTVPYVSGSKYYRAVYVDDEIDNSDFSASWTVGSTQPLTGSAGVVENTDFLHCFSRGANIGSATGTASAYSSGATALEFWNSGSDSFIEFKGDVEVSAQAASAVASGGFWLSDGTNHVALSGKLLTTSGATTSDSSVWRLFIDASEKRLALYDDGVLDTSGIDYSSLTGSKLYIRAAVNTSATAEPGIETAFTKLYYVYSLKVGGGRNLQVTGSARTVTTADNDCLVFHNNSTTLLSGFGAVTPSFSLDNGSNFVNLTNEHWGNNTSTGSQFKIKFVLAEPTSIVLGSAYGQAIISEYGGFYG